MWIDTPCFRRLAGIDTMEGRFPDETTILHFCHLLGEHCIAEQILAGVNQMLQEVCVQGPGRPGAGLHA